ncbi:MAG: D-alanine--D-alanine ligase [Lachnospiraceae bacterium]|nr:D-alanine--D-alanine ligase [Lachnospiraceae bacterium]
MMINLAVFFGGRSVEHEVSVISALQATASLDRSRYNVIPVYITKQNEMYIGEAVGNIQEYKDIPGLLKKSERVIMINDGKDVVLTTYPSKLFGKKRIRVDVAFPIVHGTNVEDGTFQGYLRHLGVPFVGCDVASSAIGMEKYAQKVILKENGIPVLDSLIFTLSDYKDVESMVERIEKRFGYPVIVKAENLGSSVGITVAKDRNGLYSAIDDSFRYARKVLVEHAITNLREINCSVLGDENEAIASEIEEPFHSKEILSYKDKYQSGGKSGSKGMASVSRQIPANVPAEMRDRIRELAVKSFKLLGCSGVSRLDFMLDTDNNELYFNEINTIPGSLAFYLWEPMGIPYGELLDRMVDLALKRAREDEKLTFSFDTNLLSDNAFSGSKGAKGAKF